MLDCSELMEAVGGEVPEEDKGLVERLRFDDGLDVPVELTDIELWVNYTNNDLYDLDKEVRRFLKSTQWKRQKRGEYRTTASCVFAWIFGRQPEPKDGATFRMLHLLLKYYCKSYTGQTTFNGKAVGRVYKFSRYGGVHKRPYSLRLRLEEAKPGDKVWKRGPGEGADKRERGRRPDSENGR